MKQRIRKLLYRARQPLRLPLAYIWRRLMFRTTVIAVTGSMGKTTTKDCLAAILARQAPTIKTQQNSNGDLGITRAILSLRPRHRYLVLEVGTDHPGQVKRMARLVKPDIAIVLAVKRNHLKVFTSPEEIAKEKAQLLKYVKRNGTVILNDDDLLVKPMRTNSKNPPVLFGTTETAQIRAEHITSVWPQRLTFSLSKKGRSQNQWVNTQFVGNHWLASVLAAIAAAEVCGVSFQASASAISTVKPFIARMQPVKLTCGAIVIRDEYNGSQDSLIAMFEVLKAARAKRRILVFSDMSDVKSKPKKRQREIGFFAAKHTDMVVFLNEHGHHAKKAAIQAGMPPDQCHHIMSLQQTAEVLKKELREGDLVFLKGCATDHLSRIFHALLGEIGCWKSTCNYRITCDQCSELQANFDVQQINVQ